VLFGGLELFLVATGLTYFLALTLSGLRVSFADRGGDGSDQAGRAGAGRRERRGSRLAARLRRRCPAPLSRVLTNARRPLAGARSRLGSRRRKIRTWLTSPRQRATHSQTGADPVPDIVYFLVPCLNEELVIEGTVRGLLKDPRALVVVIDDDSDDRTGEIAAALDPGRVQVVTRRRPQARQGKGPALNAGLVRVLADSAARGIDPAQLIVCVMDADGQLSPRALDAVLPLFIDPDVGGVQLPVRIRNRGRLLTTMQDVEFWGVAAISQLGRIGSGSVSLGGNGQFTRLSALLDIGPSPWRAQLTEDLDLALALATGGWRLMSTPQAYVSQQGVVQLKALINQRTRWYQGHMQASSWLRQLWSSGRLSHVGTLEMTMYLLMPWLLVLPWSLVFNYDLAMILSWIVGWTSGPLTGADLAQKIIIAVAWYAMSFLPIWIGGFLYCRQERGVGLFKSLLLAHLLLFGNYVTYVACWRAFYRLMCGMSRWEKTRRHEELPETRILEPGPAPTEVMVPQPRPAAAAYDGVLARSERGAHRARHTTGRMP
jgi:1,2-diacylglycerol 3-beta-glucosyltransferase